MNRENKKTLQVFEVTESITERGMRLNYRGNKYNKNINNQYNEPRKQENPTSFRSYRKHHREKYEIELPWKQNIQLPSCLFPAKAQIRSLKKRLP